MNANLNTGINKIAFIGNYLPRQCGIATFTTDLCESVNQGYADIECIAVAMNDTPEGYDYPARVRFQIQQGDLNAYRDAAEFLNLNHFNMVCLQHEFGIYGGVEGEHILTLLRELQIPVVTTLHTVLKDPNPDQRRVMHELAQLSDRLIVMSQRAVDFLTGIYAIPEEKIDFIPHGIPDIPFIDPNFFKDKFDVEGKQVILTFGLMSPNKGLENVIQALPDIIEKHPNIVYLVLGATHPHVKKTEGEKYRYSLQRLARDLNVEEHVIFFDQFVESDELVEFIGAADIYVTPYLNEAQITSGTLAYTVGSGKAVISTPYWHAVELLADGRGMLVPFNDAHAIAEQVNTLLDNEAERHAMRKRAYMLGREMIWPEVARLYMDSFYRATQERVRAPRMAYWPNTDGDQPLQLLQTSLKHLQNLTDNIGILQHSIFDLPDYREGYTTDDNARALLVAVQLEELGERYQVNGQRLATRYLAFLSYAFNPETGLFRNCLSFDRRWTEEIGSEDSHGRAMWSLGAVLHRSNRNGLRGVAGRLFDQALPAVLTFSNPRSWAFTLIGIHEYLQRFSGDRAVIHAGGVLAQHLLDMYQAHRSDDWRWFEDEVTYDNASLPYALLLASQWLGREEAASIALEALDWLASIQTAPEGYFIPVGSSGYYPRGGEKSRFDQLPVQAGAMTLASLEAYRATEDSRWIDEAQKAWKWFLGQNDLGLSLIDPETGGCRDGIHPDRLNQNQGAESLLSYLLALLEMHRVALPSRTVIAGGRDGVMNPLQDRRNGSRRYTS